MVSFLILDNRLILWMMNSREWANARPTPSANAIRNYPMDWSPGWHISCHQQWKKWKVSPLELIFYGFELYVKCAILKEIIIWFSEMLDGCRALLSIATIASPMLFDKLLKSIRWNIKSSVLALCCFPFWLLKCILTIFCSLFIICCWGCFKNCCYSLFVTSSSALFI